MFVLVTAAPGFSDEKVLQKILRQLDLTDVTLLSMHETAFDGMLESYAKHIGIPCRVFPKEDTLLRDMELIEACDGLVLVGRSRRNTRLANLGKLARRKVVRFDWFGNLER